MSMYVKISLVLIVLAYIVLMVISRLYGGDTPVPLFWDCVLSAITLNWLIACFIYINKLDRNED